MIWDFASYPVCSPNIIAEAFRQKVQLKRVSTEEQVPGGLNDAMLAHYKAFLSVYCSIGQEPAATNMYLCTVVK